MKIKRKVIVKDSVARHWNGKEGVIAGIVKEGRCKEYIVQFTNPTTWSYFSYKELRKK